MTEIHVHKSKSILNDRNSLGPSPKGGLFSFVLVLVLVLQHILWKHIRHQLCMQLQYIQGGAVTFACKNSWQDRQDWYIFHKIKSIPYDRKCVCSLRRETTSIRVSLFILTGSPIQKKRIHSLSKNGTSMKLGLLPVTHENESIFQWEKITHMTMSLFPVAGIYLSKGIYFDLCSGEIWLRNENLNWKIYDVRHH